MRRFSTGVIGVPFTALVGLVLQLPAQAAAVPVVRSITVSGLDSNASGWSSYNVTPRMMGDVDGDGKADIVAFATDGVYVSLNRSTAGSPATFGAMSRWIAQYGSGSAVGGWTNMKTYPRLLADVNGDGLLDVIGLAGDATYVSLSTKTAFQPITKWAGAMKTLLRFTDGDRNPVLAADVDGDKMADLVVFADDGIYVLISTGTGFAAPVRWSTEMVYNTTTWTSNNVFPRYLADVDGDGRADVVGFGPDGVYVALSQGPGSDTTPLRATAFGPAKLRLADFSTAATWTTFDQYPRLMADVNGDGKPDIVGFASDGIFVSINHSGEPYSNSLFGATTRISQHFGVSEFATFDAYPRHAAQLDGTGTVDLVGFQVPGLKAFATPYKGFALATGSRVDITPQRNGNGWLYYFSRAGYATNPNRNVPTQDISAFPVRARSLAIKDTSGATKILVSADILGFTREMHEKILARLGNVAPENLILNASHTHSGPILKDNLTPAYSYSLTSSDLEYVNEYTDELIDQIVASVKEATANALTVGRTATLSFNSATLAEADGGFAYYRTTIYGAPGEFSQGFPGSLPDVPVLLMKDSSGKVVAVVFTYACHGTSSPEANFHADWPGVAADLLEQMYPGAIALFVQGAGGDFNPFQQTIVAGEKVANVVAGLIDSQPAAFQPLSGVIKSAYQRVDLALSTGTETEAFPATAWSFAPATGANPLLLIATGGELVSGYAIVFKREFAVKTGSDPTRVWVAAYSNEVPGYIPSEEYIQLADYEGLGSQLYYGHWPSSTTPGAVGLKGGGVTEAQVISTVRSVVTKVIP